MNPEYSIHICRYQDVDLANPSFRNGETIELPGADLKTAIERAKQEVAARYNIRASEDTGQARFAFISEDDEIVFLVESTSLAPAA